MTTAAKPTCFIIMPISTPDAFLSKYASDGGSEHFKHILEHFFIPAVVSAGYEPVSPISAGSEIIHADIIQNLSKADLVLCDMSTLNPNVFFEFGIRTALNKPVCIVKDDLTERVPFDTSMLNYQEYASSIRLWNKDAQSAKLVRHIQDSAKSSDGKNALWKFFGLRTTGSLDAPGSPQEKQLEYLTLQIESLTKKMESKDKLSVNYFGGPVRWSLSEEKIFRRASQIDMVISFIMIDKENEMVTIEYSRASQEAIAELSKFINEYGYHSSISEGRRSKLR